MTNGAVRIFSVLQQLLYLFRLKTGTLFFFPFKPSEHCTENFDFWKKKKPTGENMDAFNHALNYFAATKKWQIGFLLVLNELGVCPEIYSER